MHIYMHTYHIHACTHARTRKPHTPLTRTLIHIHTVSVFFPTLAPEQSSWIIPGNKQHHCLRVLSCFRPVRLSATLWTAARQAPLSLGRSRQECWCGSPCPPPGIFLTQGSNLRLLRLLQEPLYHSAPSPGKPHCLSIILQMFFLRANPGNNQV